MLACYGFDKRARFTGLEREKNLLAAFDLKCLPLGASIARSGPIGPFHSYSNEDHWVERPVASGVVLIGDAAGYNDPNARVNTNATKRRETLRKWPLMHIKQDVCQPRKS